MDRVDLQAVCDHFALGEAACATAIHAGLMHTVWKLNTVADQYCAKQINSMAYRPSMWKSVPVFETEAVVARCADVLPILAGRFGEVQGQQWVIKPWIHARPLQADAITAQHCEAIGCLLGHLHAAEIQSRLGCLDEHLMQLLTHRTDERLYAALARAGACEWAHDIQALTNRCLNASKHVYLGPIVYSHRDLGPHNVLWTHHQPTVIDWELLGPIPSQLELMSVAVDWALGHDGLDWARFNALVQGYKSVGGMCWADYDMPGIMAGVLRMWLDWVAFCLSCGLEGHPSGFSAARLSWNVIRKLSAECFQSSNFDGKCWPLDTTIAQ